MSVVVNNVLKSHQPEKLVKDFLDDQSMTCAAWGKLAAHLNNQANKERSMTQNIDAVGLIAGLFTTGHAIINTFASKPCSSCCGGEKNSLWSFSFSSLFATPKSDTTMLFKGETYSDLVAYTPHAFAVLFTGLVFAQRFSHLSRARKLEAASMLANVQAYKVSPWKGCGLITALFKMLFADRG